MTTPTGYERATVLTCLRSPVRASVSGLLLCLHGPSGSSYRFRLVSSHASAQHPFQKHKKSPLFT